MKDLTRILILLFSVFFANCLTKQKHNWIWYLIIGLIGYLFFFGLNKCYPNEFEYLIEKQCTIEELHKFSLESRDHYLKEAERYYKEAQELCWYYPKTEDRDKAKYCFTTCIILIGPGSNPSKLVMGLLNLLMNYGLDCMSEWHEINWRLEESANSYQMYEFFRDVVIEIEDQIKDPRP